MSTPSKEKIKNELIHCLDASLSKLHRIWSDIGICESQRQERSNTVMLHLRNLLDEMVQEEDTLKTQILMRIEKYTKEATLLCDELGVPEFKPKGSSMLQREKELRAKLDALSKEKHERMRILKKFKEQDQHLCDVMCLTPYYIPSGTTPTAEQLQALEIHVGTLKAEKEKRYTDFVGTKKKIIILFNEMDRNPESDFERDVLCEEDNSFLLSTENMKTLKTLVAELEEEREETIKMVDNLWEKLTTLWDRLCIPEEDRSYFREGKDGFKQSVITALKDEIAQCERMKLENIQRFVDGMRKELVSWWDKCFYCKRWRDEFTPFTDENYTEELLEKHDKEVNRVKQYYETHQKLFEDISRWEILFKQMIEFERKANDPNRFNNRGGMLLQEEKARKKVLKELPKLEEEVKENIMSWEKENGRDFLVDGVRFLQYIEQQWILYQNSKIKEKEKRHKAKAKQTEEEMIFGSKPSTPAKRRFLTTPTKTPVSKIRRMNDTTKTPVSCSRLQHTTNTFASPYPRAPASTSKMVAPSKTPRRRSNRIARKVLSEKNVGGHTNDETFSQTTVSSCGQTHGGNFSVASTGTYQDFNIQTTL